MRQFTAILLLILLAAAVPAAGKNGKTGNKDRDELFVSYNTSYESYKSWSTDFGTLEFRRGLEHDMLDWERNYGEEEKVRLKEYLTYFQKSGIQPMLPVDELLVPFKENHAEGKGDISLSLLYEIDDNFKYLCPLFKIGNDVYFRFRSVHGRNGKSCFGGICRLNGLKWYDLVTHGNFSHLADLGGGKVLALHNDHPERLYGFRADFSNEFYVELDTPRLRQEVYKINDRRFLIHNLRINPCYFAVEVYDISGNRITECFNYISHSYDPGTGELPKFPITAQTVAAGSGRGNFYVGFVYPQNPYRIWKYDERGEKVQVLGNYFVHPDVYEFPEEWVYMKFEDLNYYGLNRIYAINKLLVDHHGRLYVYFTLNRRHRFGGKNESRGFLDIYSEKGEFLGRKAFPYGMPDVVYNGNIYCRQKTGWRAKKITVVRCDIEEKEEE